MFRPLIVLSFTTGVAACNDRDIFSMAPYEKVDEFKAMASVEEVDHILSSLARRRGLEFNRELRPQSRRNPRDYLATVLADSCMLLVEGQGPSDSMTLTLSLEAAREKSCGSDITQVFEDAQRILSR